MQPGQTRAAESSAPTRLAPCPGRGGAQASPPRAAATSLWVPARPPPAGATAAGQDAPGHPLRDGDAPVQCPGAPRRGQGALGRAPCSFGSDGTTASRQSPLRSGLRSPVPGLSLRGSHGMHQVHGPGSTCDMAPACRHPTRSPRRPDAPLSVCGSLQGHGLIPPALQTSTVKANFMGNRSNRIAIQFSTCRSLVSGRQNPDDHKGSLRCRSSSGSITEQSRCSHRGDRQRHWPHTHEGRPETRFFTFSRSGGVALPCIPVTRGQPVHHVSCDMSSEFLFFI